jgi:hypothetical protein
MVTWTKEDCPDLENLGGPRPELDSAEYRLQIAPCKISHLAVHCAFIGLPSAILS